MKYSLTTISMLCCVVFFMYSCEQSEITGTHGTTLEKQDTLTESIPVQVDIQEGFADLYISVRFNDEIYFVADLCSGVPLAGPVALFRTSLPQGRHALKVTWSKGRTIEPPPVIDSVQVEIQAIERVYIGIERDEREDTLRVEVREKPFEYV